MIASADASFRRRDELTAAFAAARTRLGLVAGLLALAGVGWWWTVDQMNGMDDGPWTELGTLGWFLGVWVVMMAAMMLPSVSPTVALYARMTSAQSGVRPLLFAVGYLVTWAAAGVVAFVIAFASDRAAGGVLSWDRSGRWVAAVTLIAAAVYELTPVKDACLGRCRSPLGLLLGSWRDGLSGAFRMGAKNGAWCIGCCWALMAAFFALGIMSVVWMSVIAGVIAIEKTLPWRRVATYATTVLLFVLGALLFAAPHAVPGLTIPASGSMSQMNQMGP